ncbi:MAG: RnfH family protein [Pseudomonadota bacterium]|nr:RnfH family protein [Pseudomonadota bacterium]
MHSPPRIDVELAYAEPTRAVVKRFCLTSPATIGELLRLARQATEFDGIDLNGAAVGIYGRRVDSTHVLSDGDRVELYRPLVADPKLARRARARRSNRSG